MSIIRVQHTEKYVVIKKTALEDPRLSFKAKGLWAYCMSRPNDWEFNITHLSTISQEGEHATYSAIKELIKHGYAERFQSNKGKGSGNGRGGFGRTDYIIYEEPKIQKSFTLRENPDAGNPDPGNQALLSIDPILNIEKDTKAPTSQAEALAIEFHFALQDAHGEHIKKPNLESWSKEFDKMIRLDARDPALIRKVMNWSVQDNFWKSNILSPKKLREKFLTLKIKMDSTISPTKKPKKDYETWMKEQENAPTPSESDITLQL